MSERRKGRSPGRLAAWLLGVALIAAFTHLAAVHVYPRLLMHGAWQAISEVADDTGLLHAPRPDATSRTVVRPSPDLVYSVCLYDLAAGPWSIRLEVPDSYMSVSLYAMNTDNFFTVNDRQAPRGSMELLIVSGPVDEYEAATGGRPLVVRAPGERGMALVRYFAGSGANAAAIEAARRTLACGPGASRAEMAPSDRARRTGDWPGNGGDDA
ncbi:DUF1254 domain-containing protein [Lentisalinibacter sediminis]|uniref:DUF1254 domain-containing protein n=1 Tax=Lentisalinibacter sediminis TaxID=2992237 RepID=UPI003863EF5C